MFAVGDKIYADYCVAEITKIEGNTFYFKALAQFRSDGTLIRVCKTAKVRKYTTQQPQYAFVSQKDLNEYLQHKINILQKQITDIQSVMVP